MTLDDTSVDPTGLSGSMVEITPAEIANRRQAEWNGVAVDAVEFTERAPFSYRFRARTHMLIISERQARHDGETRLEGLPKSRLREFSHTLSFVPAGHHFTGWHQPRVLTRVTYLHLDPTSRLLESELHFSEIELKPRLFFFDQDLWDTALKLKAQAGAANPSSYAEALALVMAHELIRLERGTQALPRLRGGLATWQQKRVVEFIEEHLNEDISLKVMADVARLSPYHFAHAFKQSFGDPPHRYVIGRRMQRAKTLLAAGALSVTEIGQAVGFAETSSFTAAFRRSTGMTPTGYRQHLEHPYPESA
jgi:AraC family transcriptional regulator